MAPLWSPNLHGRKIKTEIEEIEKGEKKPPRIGASQKCRPGRGALGGDVGLGEAHTLLAQLLHVRSFEVGVVPRHLNISALTCHKSRAPEYHHILSHLIPAEVICKDEDNMRRILTS